MRLTVPDSRRHLRLARGDHAHGGTGADDPNGPRRLRVCDSLGAADLRRCPIKFLGQRSRKRNFTTINRKKIQSCGEKPWLEISECLAKSTGMIAPRYGRRGL